MGEVVYRSQVHVERGTGALRYATVPAEDTPVIFGVHGEVAAHYGRREGQHEPHATTLDYVVAAAAGWLAGTLGGALEARGIPAGDGRLQADATGEVELDNNTLVLKRISVRYRLQAGPGADRSVIDWVMGFHADHCPVARSLRGAINITTSIELISA